MKSLFLICVFVFSADMKIQEKHGLKWLVWLKVICWFLLSKCDYHDFRKIAFCWGHGVSLDSADRAPYLGSKVTVQWQTVQSGSPSLHTALRAPPSSWQLSLGHVLWGCAWSRWIPPPVEGRRHKPNKLQHLLKHCESKISNLINKGNTIKNLENVPIEAQIKKILLFVLLCHICNSTLLL